MISNVLFVFSLAICISCKSDNSEQKLLTKMNPADFYGNMSKTDKVFSIDQLIKNSRDNNNNIVLSEI